MLNMLVKYIVGQEVNGDCPDDETFALYLDHKLSKKESLSFMEHIVKCNKCANKLAELKILKNYSNDILEETTKETTNTPLKMLKKCLILRSKLANNPVTSFSFGYITGIITIILIVTFFLPSPYLRYPETIKVSEGRHVLSQEKSKLNTQAVLITTSITADKELADELNSSSNLQQLKKTLSRQLKHNGIDVNFSQIKSIKLPDDSVKENAKLEISITSNGTLMISFNKSQYTQKYN